VLPLLPETHNSQVPLASVPYLAWSTVTTPAPPVKSKFIPRRPLLRTRADCEPVLTSVVVLPSKASFSVQEPEASVTLPVV